MFIKLFNDLNQRYGLNIQIDFDSFSESLKYIIDPKNKKALEFFISEVYSRIKLILYFNYLNAYCFLSELVLDPGYLLLEQDKLKVAEKLDKFMKNFIEICNEINIPYAEMKLKKLNETFKNKLNFNNFKIEDYLKTSESEDNETSKDKSDSQKE